MRRLVDIIHVLFYYHHYSIDPRKKIIYSIEKKTKDDLNTLRDDRTTLYYQTNILRDGDPLLPNQYIMTTPCITQYHIQETNLRVNVIS